MFLDRPLLDPVMQQIVDHLKGKYGLNETRCLAPKQPLPNDAPDRLQIYVIAHGLNDAPMIGTAEDPKTHQIERKSANDVANELLNDVGLEKARFHAVIKLACCEAAKVHPNSNTDSFAKLLATNLTKVNKNLIVGGYDKKMRWARETSPIIKKVHNRPDGLLAGESKNSPWAEQPGKSSADDQKIHKKYFGAGAKELSQSEVNVMKTEQNLPMYGYFAFNFPRREGISIQRPCVIC